MDVDARENLLLLVKISVLLTYIPRYKVTEVKLTSVGESMGFYFEDRKCRM